MSANRTRKNFVLDTNVLLHDPNALFHFKDNVVLIPIYVIEEIDGFKKELSELGRNARTVGRLLDELRAGGRIAEGVPLPNGGTLRVGFTAKQLPPEVTNSHKQDNRILALAIDVRDSNPGQPTILVTKDINLRIRADALGLHVEDYDPGEVDISELYSGVTELEVDGAKIASFYQNGYLAVETSRFYPNQYALLKDAGGTSTALGRINSALGRVEAIRKFKQEGVWGIRPRNKEQHFALDVLLDDSVKLVTLVGKAGTGKTLLALAAGLHKVMEEKIYQRLLVARPIFPMGRDIGYLPGTMEEKLSPWMQPIFDNVDFLLGLTRADRQNGRGHHELVDLGVLQIEPLTYIRGRSIPNQWIVIDEAQNLTPHEVKTIITRVGEGTKIVFTGDPYQIDHPYIDSANNGLTYVVNKFKEQKIAGHLTLQKGERSELAELAANLL
jgi:PhoH-like ATPase